MPVFYFKVIKFALFEIVFSDRIPAQICLSFGVIGVIQQYMVNAVGMNLMFFTVNEIFHLFIPAAGEFQLDILKHLTVCETNIRTCIIFGKCRYRDKDYCQCHNDPIHVIDSYFLFD